MRSRAPLSHILSVAVSALLVASISMFAAAPRVSAAALNIPLEVKNEMAVQRTSEPVTTGIPIPRSADIKAVSDLNVVDATMAPVLSQFSVTARWGGAPGDGSLPVKWLLVTFMADVAPSSSAVYRVTSGLPNQSSSELSVTRNDTESLVVSTGAAEFELSKRRGSFFERVRVGSTVVTDSDQNGIVILEEGGREAASCEVEPRRVTVIEQGPARIAVKVEGNLDATVPARADYETVMYFYAGKSFASVLHSQVNHDTLKLVDYSWKVYNYYDPGSLTFTSLGIRHSIADVSGTLRYLAPAEGGTSSGAIEAYSVVQGSSGTDYWDAYNDTPYSIGGQDYPDGDHPRPNSYQAFQGYRAANGAAQVDSGAQHRGWLDISDSGKGLTMGVADFWQNFPKGFSADALGAASVDLWPEDPSYHDGYNLRVGDKKTHNLFFYFHEGTAVDADAAEVAVAMLHPMWALAPSQWYSASGAITEYSTATESLEERLGAYHTEQLDDAQAYDYYNDRTLKEDSSVPWWSTHPCMSMVEGDGHPSSRDYFNMYGWSFYGNQPLEEEAYGDSKCAFFDNKYDFDFGAWLQYLRTGDERWRDLAQSMSRHQEMLMLHDVELENGWDPAEYRNAVFGHCMHVERGCENGVRNYNSSTPQFAWGARGAALHYYLTGYPPSGEFAAKLAGYMYNIWQFRTMTPGLYEGGGYGESGGVREPATTLNVLVEGWKLTGDAKYQQLAQELMDMYAPEDQFYIDGPVEGTADRNIPVGFFAHYLCAMARYAQVAVEHGLLAEADTAKQRLERFVDFMVTHTTFTWNGLFSSHYRWQTDGSSQPDQGEVNNWTLVCADACAYVYGFTRESEWLDRARDYFHTGVNSPYCGDLQGKLFYTSTKEAANHAVHGGAYMYFAALAEGAPTVTSISPDRAESSELIEITDLLGTNFATGAAVRLSRGSGQDIHASDVTVHSANRISCTIDLEGAASGTWDVVVTNPDGKEATLEAGFTVMEEEDDDDDEPGVPHISGISPTSGPEGAAVTVSGSDLGEAGTSFVTFNGTRATCSSWSSTRIVASVPRGATSGPLVVTTPAGESNGIAFTVTKEACDSVWYLAEGSSDWGFKTLVNIQNPNAVPVTARLTYMTRSGRVQVPDIRLPASSQTTIDPAVSLGATDMSTRVECLEGKQIAVDRRMVWTGEGAPASEAHSSVGVTGPAKTWYLAEGSSDWGFETWVLVQNPNARDVTCELTYMIEGEGPRAVEKVVPANARASFNMADDIGRRDASVLVTAPSAVVVERAMYRDSRREGHGSVGVTAASKEFYLAEGTTDYGFTTYVLVQNPNDKAATVRLTCMTADGPVEQPAFQMPALSRKTVRLNDSIPARDCSIRVRADVGIIAERAMYWDSGQGEACHGSVGTSAPHTTFYMPDGQTSEGWETWVLVQNPNTTDVNVQVSYFTSTGEGNVTVRSVVPAQSRRTFNMGEKIEDGRASALVTCLTSGKKIVAERAMYSNGRAAGTCTIGAADD